MGLQTTYQDPQPIHKYQDSQFCYKYPTYLKTLLNSWGEIVLTGGWGIDILMEEFCKRICGSTIIKYVLQKPIKGLT